MAFKLFPKVKRLPTLLGILILVAGIAATTYLAENVNRFFLKAEPAVSPQKIKTSNLTPTTFTVSWITPGNSSSGYLKFGKTQALGKVNLDDRDQNIDNLGKFTVHHVTVSNLESRATYYFKVISQGKEYDDNGAPYRITTASANSSTTPLNPTFGMVLEENSKPPKEGIVYVKVGSSSLVSTLIKPSGNWLVPLAPLLNQDLKGPLVVKPEDAEEILVQGEEKTSKAVTTLTNNTPVPEIVLGKDYDFRTAISPTPTSAEITPSLLSPVFSLTHPASNAAVPGQPLFRGTGYPGKTVEIKVESETTLNNTVTVDQNGNWIWQPPTNLPVGEHTVTVATTDNQGKIQTIIRKFVILASGTQVVEAATPSATTQPTPTSQPSPTPTPKVTTSPTPSTTIRVTPTSKPTSTPSPTISVTPTPTPKLTLSPTPQATTGGFPASGDLLLTLLLAGSGICFITLGLFFLKPKAF